MKIALAFLALGACASLAFAADKPLRAELIKIPGEQVKLVENTLSPDGRYAAGWTVSAKKGKPAVDWKKLGQESDAFIGDYLDNDGYVVTDLIVDLSQHSIVARLRFTDPYYDRKAHGALEVAYGPEQDGHRYAIALSDGNWASRDVVLVDLAPGGAAQTDCTRRSTAPSSPTSRPTRNRPVTMPATISFSPCRRSAC